MLLWAILYIDLCHIHHYFLKSVSTTGILGSKVYLLLSLLTDCSVAFRKDSPMFMAQTQFMPQACISQTPCTVPSKHQLLRKWLGHWTHFCELRFLICEVGKSFSLHEPHPLCLANGVEIHYFPVAGWGLKETMHVKKESVEKWFMV